MCIITIDVIFSAIDVVLLGAAKISVYFSECRYVQECTSRLLNMLRTSGFLNAADLFIASNARFRSGFFSRSGIINVRYELMGGWECGVERDLKAARNC